MKNRFLLTAVMLLFACIAAKGQAQKLTAMKDAGTLKYKDVTYHINIENIGKDAKGNTTVEITSNDLNVPISGNNTEQMIASVSKYIMVKIVAGDQTYDAKNIAIKNGSIRYDIGADGSATSQWAVPKNIVYTSETTATPDRIIVYNDDVESISFDVPKTAENQAVATQTAQPVQTVAQPATSQAQPATQQYQQYQQPAAQKQQTSAVATGTTKKQNIWRKGYIGMDIGAAIPTGEFIADNCDVGVQINFDFGYLFSEHVGITSTFLFTTFTSKYQTNNSVGLVGLMAGPMFTFGPESKVVEFDLKPLLGFAMGSLYEGSENTTSDLAVCIGAAALLRWNAWSRVSLSGGLNYYYSTPEEVDLSSLGITVGVNFRF